MAGKSIAFLLLTIAAAAGAPAIAANDPTVQQIYQAAHAGRLDQAQQMMNQVLRDHPRSGKAHYVAAELYAKEGDAPRARMELGQAESIAPGLPFADAHAVRALKAQLTLTAHRATTRSAPAAHAFPWGAVLLIGILVSLVVVALRRRGQAAQPVTYAGAAYPPGGAPPYGAAGMYGPGFGPGAGPMSGGGIGSGIVGGLASGLAVGAGVVAGERLVEHFLDGGQGGAAAAPGQFADDAASNADMGGNDFGIADDPGSWDDSGGGDWS